ncbi:OFA family MFS transporter [Acinetobacter sp. MD2(2019)]|uniref:OFA family MFS transporter n=1 Tax=Acinetobacter sp. MD2(2019) TaxID=2605273 RepID=UPI002D1F75FA|nr:OFA family MFS transporter [Acinetobacter sp. MD2(2019)]MEB3752738.1 OFA family MFS transporter [Acinetobacter sp. MD2(2019)]
MPSSTQSVSPPFLSKQRIIANAGFNRWLVPPAALAIHLCIGMAYGFSVFWLPLSKALGISQPIACAADIGFFQQLFIASCDWKVSTLGWMYTLFFVLLGSSAAIWGGWLEKVGPRKAGLLSAVCWCGGMLISALGIYLHQFWLMLLGSGVIGGIGLGLGYISPVSTLIKWFPDKRGLATGMAIMGFGGGAMIGSPLAVELMSHFSSPSSVGVAQTFVVMALIYFVFMVAGALTYRIPAVDWKPKHWQPKATVSGLITPHHVHVDRIWGIPQFWLVWLVLCMNVSAGIGIIGMASPMLQEVFAGNLLGKALSFSQLNEGQLKAVAAIAAGFTALLSLFNIGGRIAWASLSDKIGRKTTYNVFFILGIILYISLPFLAAMGSKFLFVSAICIIISMYGGGFAAVPAYLADLFGTQMVGAIHGRLLTAWATAGVIGPVVVNNMRDYQLSLGIPASQVYNQTMFILAGLLGIGLICNLMIKPIAAKYFMSEQELAEAQNQMIEQKNQPTGMVLISQPTAKIWVVLAWLAVGIPLLWGIYRTLMSIRAFF